MNPKLSVVLATFNEQTNIKACLESVHQLADELIVVDGSSKDKTRELAKKLGARVFKTTNKSMFHINKQIAVNKAKYKWILQLDADERVTANLKKEIMTVLQSQNPKAGYYIPRKNFFLSRFLTKGGQYPDYVIRLFQKSKGKFPCKSVHEQIAIKGPTGHLKHPLLHYSDPSFSRYMTRFNRYTSLEAQKLHESKTKPGISLLISYVIIKPFTWFFKTFFRHKALVDGLPGFIFSLMSSLRFPVTYFKLWELQHARST